MSRGFATVAMVGNLTRDPELRTLQSGKSVCQLGVAVGYSYKDASGGWQDKASFFDVMVWGAQGEACAQYLAKGRQVAIHGRLDQRTWDGQDGSKRSKVEIVADQVVFVGGREGGQSKPAANEPANDFRDIDFGEDDDLPF